PGNELDHRNGLVRPYRREGDRLVETCGEPRAPARRSRPIGAASAAGLQLLPCLPRQLRATRKTRGERHHLELAEVVARRIPEGAGPEPITTRDPQNAHLVTEGPAEAGEQALEPGLALPPRLDRLGDREVRRDLALGLLPHTRALRGSGHSTRTCA